MEWQGHKVSWKPPSYLYNNPLPDAMSNEAHAFFIDHTIQLDEFIDNFHQFENSIKESKYEYTATEEAVKQQTHLNVAQQKQLGEVLRNFQPLFNGKLGRYPYAKVHLELEPNTQPAHTRPYPIAELNKKVFKLELDRLCDIGVLSPTGPSESLPQPL